MGPEAEEDKSVRLLSRVMHWTLEGVRYEADQRHAELVIRDMGLEGNTNSIVTPGGRKEEESMGKKF